MRYALRSAAMLAVLFSAAQLPAWEEPAAQVPAGGGSRSQSDAVAAQEVSAPAAGYRKPADSGPYAVWLTQHETSPGSGEFREKIRFLTRNEAAGSTVSIEGIAHGGRSKAGPVILFHDASLEIHLTAETEKSWHDGKLVRVVGVLERRVDPPLPPGYQGTGPGVRYWMRPQRVEAIDRADHPHMRIVKIR